MKRCTMSIALVAALLSVTVAQAGEFSGAYVGGKIGYNNNTPTSSATYNKGFFGGEAGYGWNVGKAMLGLDGFADDHAQSATGRDDGVDVKMGYPMGKWMPYAKLGVTGSNPGDRTNGAVGVEYKFAPQWSVVGELFTDSYSVNGVDHANTNATVGVSYYFNSSRR